MFHKNNKNPHFLQKLTNREITGNFIRQGKSNSQNSSASKLFKTIPSRCVYQLSNVIDLPGNHVFMGTSRCGQFLLTYSFITHQARSSLSQRNKYQLHWWLFRPGAKAAKVAEVQLFADYAVTSILTIGIAHWPTVSDRLVVYGFCNNAEDYLEEDHRRYYLTITTLPSLDCRDCLTVAASFDEEDMAANWDSCVSFSCLKHGLTIHSLFDVTPPYPKFDFNISLKLNNSVVFNTVNFLHVLSFEFENPKPDRPAKNEQTIVNEEINHRVGQIMTSKYPKEYALPYDINKAFNTGNSLAKHVMKQTQPTHLPPPASQPTRTSSILHAREKSSRQWCIRIPNLAMKPVSIRTKVWRRSIIDQAEKTVALSSSMNSSSGLLTMSSLNLKALQSVYAFEESEDGGCEPKLKWYRRKRLADKMYEFCSDEDDEDMENIRPPDKWGTKLPRYKCLSPPKTTPTKCDVIDSRLSQSEAGLQHPFTKMILNISGNDTRYVIQNTDCCKRLINMKTDADSEIRHKIGSETADHSCNNSRLDETSCARRHRDMDKPVGIQNIQPKSNDTLEDTCRRDRNIMDKSVTNQISPGTECSCESASSKTNNSRLVETCCDAQRRDMENSKENSRREETGCDKQIHVTDKPLEIPPNDHVKTNDILDETCCERSDRDINTPVIIQIPPINLPFCVPSGKKDEPLLKEPVFLTPAAVSDRRVVSDTVSNPLSEVASLLDTVSKMNTRSVENVTDSSEVSDTPESSSSSMIHDTLRDSVSLSPVIDASQINSVSNTTICDKNVPGPNDSVSNPCSVNTADVMDTVDSLVIVDNNKIGSSIKTLSEHSSGNSATVDLNCETNGVSIDTESNISSSIIDKTVSNSPSTNFDNVCRSSKDVSNSFSTDTDSATNSFPLMNENLCNTLNDNISQFCSTDSVCNTSKECLSNSSSTNTDRRNVSKDVVSNSPPSIVDNRNVCNDTVSNLRATYETSNINHDVRAIIADWEADSISSMSPQSEFSSSVTTCNSPKVLSDYSLEIGGENTNERHMTIQRFLEIPPRFGIVKKNFHHNHHHHLHHHRSSSNITSNLNDTGRKLVCPSPTNTNVTRCVPVGLSASQYPPIKLRALQPHNRIRRSYRHDPLLSPPLKCFGIEKEEELRRKKVGSGRSEGGGDSFEMKRRREGKMVGGDCVNKSEVKLVGDSFEVKRRRDVKVGGSGEMKVDGLDLKRKKKDCGDGGGSLEDEFVDILDNIVGRRTISDCSVQLDRRFIEVDEEMISTITDIEDDDQAVGFHCALPLHVHGSAYAQMQMVSNHKVDKLNVPCVSVRQNSLDIEQLCSKAAEVICECEGFKFWFCDDYDAEIVDVCPLDGSVLIVVFMRLNVERLNVPAAETAGFTSPVVVDRRHFYECKCLFIWSTARQECSLEVFTHLRAVPHDRVNVDGWSPAGREAARMRRKAETGFFHLQPSPAIRAFVHRLYDDDDNQTDSALEVQDPTNLMLFRLYPVNSNMKINSNRIVVL